MDETRRPTRRLHRRGWAWTLTVLTALTAFPALTGGVAHAQEPLPVEIFFQRPSIQAVQMSPGGRRLAFTAEVKGRVGAFVIDLASADFKIGRVALFSDIDVNHVHWVDDERLVHDVVDLGEVSGADYSGAPGLYAVQHDGSDPRMLVERHDRTYDGRGQRLSALPRNHRLLHVPIASGSASSTAGTGARAGEVIVGRPDVDSGGSLRAVTPLWLDTRSGETRVMELSGAPDRALYWWFSATGQPRAVLTRHKERDTLYWRHLPGDGRPGGWRALEDAPEGKLRIWPAWVGEGDSLYVTHRQGERGERVLAPFDFTTGRPGTPWIVTRASTSADTRSTGPMAPG